MVFPSVPIYLDPPNWNQQAHQFGINSTGSDASIHLPHGATTTVAAPRPEASLPGQSSNPGPARPGSMAERARLARIPQPEQALKCPRCESSNTKFCYYNNYSLSQPRHFCKTCRRYWTRGGALRNVPVGGGCRRNKRSKSSSSKSSAGSTAAAITSTSTSSSAATTSNMAAIASSRLPFLPPLHPILDYGTPNLGLGFAGVGQPAEQMEYHITSGGGSGGLVQHMQQFPFLGGLDPPQQTVAPIAGMYRLGLEGGGGIGEGVFSRHGPGAGLAAHLASVKMEESNPHGLNIPRPYMSISQGDNIWNSNSGIGSGNSGGGDSASGGWVTDIQQGFNSSSAAGNLS